jgi:hypothetical protein
VQGPHRWYESDSFSVRAHVVRVAAPLVDERDVTHAQADDWER